MGNMTKKSNQIYSAKNCLRINIFQWRYDIRKACVNSVQFIFKFKTLTKFKTSLGVWNYKPSKKRSNMFSLSPHYKKIIKNLIYTLLYKRYIKVDEYVK